MSTEPRLPSSPILREPSPADSVQRDSGQPTPCESRRSEPARPNPRRVVLTEDGPALIDGPVDLVTADGETLHCDRFVVALCLCRRSSTYPLCDTSHRRRHRPRSAD
ncbi:CDGSH iron-sulfur domain-containing protein [Nocardia sp. NPDC058705]|uniref:CDGSH iron-sulfur domain-containing protein n=1 Tax=Nocardia sp. NPDC058705 TaxID=3346609 RepID=UPI0036B538F3